MAIFRNTGNSEPERNGLSGARVQTVHPPSIIGARSRVEGTITGSGPLTVKGEVDGKISLTDRLTIAPEARIEAEVEAGWVELQGHLKGSVRAHTQIRIMPSGRLEGDAVAPKARIDLGAVLQGGLLIRAHPTRRPG